MTISTPADRIELAEVSKTGCGEKIFKYTKDFLSNRTPVIKIGEETCQLIVLGDRGTPQGSVLSPMLFNLAVLPLPAILNTIEGIGRAIYADDITIWTSEAGSDGWMEEALQHAANAVHDCAQSCGLCCFPPKSELVITQQKKFAPSSRREC